MPPSTQDPSYWEEYRAYCQTREEAQLPVVSYRNYLRQWSRSAREHGKGKEPKGGADGGVERVEVLPLHLHHHYGRDKQMTRVEKLPRYPRQRVEILLLRPVSLPIWPATRRPDKFCRSLAIRHFHTWIWPVEEPSRT